MAVVTTIPHDRAEAVLAFGDRRVRLTNLDKPFFPAVGLRLRTARAA